MPSSIPITQAWIKAIIYSITLHVIALSLFKLVVPLKKVPHKPILVFFGALFQDSDFLDLTSRQNSHSLLSAPVPNYSYDTQTPYTDRSVSKPIYFEAVKSQPKITPKIFESQNEDKKSLISTEIEELHIPATPSYTPLRFQTK